MQVLKDMMPTKLPVTGNLVEVVLIQNELAIPVSETPDNRGLKKRKRRNWNPEGTPLRRSERIRQLSLKKKNLESIEKPTNVGNDNRKTGVKKPRQYRRRKNVPTIRNSSQTAISCDNSQISDQANEEYYNCRIAEKVVGQRMVNGVDYILVKWKDIEIPEYVENKNISRDILNLFSTFLQEELLKLAFRNDEQSIVKKEASPCSTEYSLLQLQTAEQIQASSPGISKCIEIKLE